MSISTYNPASLRIKEDSSGFNVSGVVCLVFPDGTATDLGRGIVEIVFSTATVAFEVSDPLTGTQDGVNPTFTVPGTLSWTNPILFRNGLLADRTTYSSGGTGNRTITFSSAFPDGTGGAGNELLVVIGVAA